MKLEPGDIVDLRPIIAAVVRHVLDEVQEEYERLNGRLGYGEAEAAALLGLSKHVLRDARLRGELVASKIGKRIVYSRGDLAAFLVRQKCD